MSRQPMDPGIEALLDAERSVDGLPDAMNEALKAATFSRLGLPIGGGGGGPASGGPASGGPEGSPSSGPVGGAGASTATSTAGAGASKLMITALVSGALGIAIGMQLERASQVSVASLDPVVVQGPAREPEPVPEPIPEPTPEPRLETEIETAMERSSRMRPELQRDAQPAEAEEPARIRAREERILIDRARAALGARDYRGVFRTLLRHEAEHADGVMAEEREALRVQALAASGERARAERALQRFEARFPASPLRGRLRRELER